MDYLCTPTGRSSAAEEPRPILLITLIFYRMKEIQTKRTPRFRALGVARGYAAFASLRRQVTIGVLSVSMSTILLSTTTPVQAQTVDSLTIARELGDRKGRGDGGESYPHAQYDVVHLRFRSKGGCFGAGPDPRVCAAFEPCDRSSGTERQGNAGGHYDPGRFLRPDDGHAQRY